MTSSRCWTASTACSSAAARISTPRPTGASATRCSARTSTVSSDEYELALLRAATARDLPLLAICRGMQALNVSRGGTLHQHLPDLTELEHRQAHEAFEPAHAVSVTTGSPLHRLTGRRELEVNSLHHQAIDDLGAGLAVCAHAPDGTIEAVYDPQLRFCLGVQWHAELLTHKPEHAPLLGELVAAARPRPPC